MGKARRGGQDPGAERMGSAHSTASLGPQPNPSSWRGELRGQGPAATVLCLHGAQATCRRCSWPCCEWAGRVARGCVAGPAAARGGAVGGAGSGKGWLSLRGTAVPCCRPRRSCPEPGLGPRRHWQVSSRHHQTRTLDYGQPAGAARVTCRRTGRRRARCPKSRWACMKMFLKGVLGGCSGWDKQGQDRQSPALLGCTVRGSGRG